MSPVPVCRGAQVSAVAFTRVNGGPGTYPKQRLVRGPDLLEARGGGAERKQTSTLSVLLRDRGGHVRKSEVLTSLNFSESPPLSGWCSRASALNAVLISTSVAPTFKPKVW